MFIINIEEAKSEGSSWESWPFKFRSWTIKLSVSSLNKGKADNHEQKNWRSLFTNAQYAIIFERIPLV